MKTPLDYFALALALLPASAVLAYVLCAAWTGHRRWTGGNTRRRQSWHRKAAGVSHQERR